MNDEIRKYYAVLGIGTNATDQEVYNARGIISDFYKDYPNMAPKDIQEKNEAYEKIMAHRNVNKQHPVKAVESNISKIVPQEGHERARKEYEEALKEAEEWSKSQKKHTAMTRELHSGNNLKHTEVGQSLSGTLSIDAEIKECPFCAEMIKSEAIKCRFCGEWLDTKPIADGSDEPLKNQKKLRGQNYSQHHEVIKEEPRTESSPQQSIVSVPSIAKKDKKPYASFSWKSFIAAVVIAAFLVAFVSAAMGVKAQRNIIWTALWIYLTIEAWRNWKWKALLPYTTMILTHVIAGLIMVSIGVEYRSLTYLIVIATLNIGGLIIFYWLLHKSQKEFDIENK